MRRRTFIKKMMAYGFSRNAVNNLTKSMIRMRDERRKGGEKIYVTWSYVYDRCLFQMENTDFDVDIKKISKHWEKIR